tara:strand:+ start:1955 stop:6385 length:4431 start_codon:yes stop_codon:yes gene_type:complete
MSESMIFPVAFDLGAANTGVFALLYPAGTQIESGAITKLAFTARVPTIKAGGYSLLQTGRTQKRHIRRCQTRDRQAKRLFTLILERIYGFAAAEHQEAIAELMNRRGYSYVEKAEVDFGAPESLDFSAWLPLIESENVLEALQDLDTQNLNQSIDALFEDEPAVIFELEELINAHDWHKGKGKSPERQFAKGLLDFANAQTRGAKHRCQFFFDIAEDLKHYTEHPSKTVRRLGHELHQHKPANSASARFMPLFHRILCHVSNLELKTLNAMLPAGIESGSAEELEKHWAEIFGRWILKQWQTSSKNKPERIVEIKQLREIWKAFTEASPGKLFEFWLKIDPEQTIPPYQNHTNRRPPSCQTLILNPGFLDQAYPQWRNWLQQLQSTDVAGVQNYQQALHSALSKNDNPLASTDELDARTLQVFLDASQSHDPLKLKSIWSLLKKAHENQRHGNSIERQQAELSALVQESALPENLKSSLTVGGDQALGGFWHLLNRYYQTRRRSRNGRYFLHYDNSVSSLQNRWQREGNLMVMCSHRPRQLKHQALQDILALWGMAEAQLRAALLPGEWNIETLDEFLFAIKGLKTRCKEALTLQKQHGPYLGAMLQTDKKLIDLQVKLREDSKRLASRLFNSETQQQQFVERNSSLYQFAQLYALVWEDRSGFGKTCPLCSVDNAQRMQPQEGNTSSRASRLNTLSMRLIDGGLKRLLTHQAHHIANRLWPLIEPSLSNGNRVSVPLVLEQNRFDFTENLADLKGVKKKEGKAMPDVYEAKQERIVNQGKGICPYPGGNSTSLEAHEIDHIIPRTGPWGVLNDEANLICASRNGNRNKGNRMLTLADLNPAYLKAQFGTADMHAITQSIESCLWKSGSEQFVFGQYRQFLALTAEQQTAFRHALFLPAEHSLRQQVIDAIQHRQKARVNGTQRYMAQLLADIVWQKARKIGADKQLEFDYFEISSNPADENSTVALRRILECVDPASGVDLRPYKKKAGISQKEYSHVIDAMCAMTLAVDAHQGEGALRLELPRHCTPWGVNQQTGEVTPGLYGLLQVPESQVSPAVQVKPQSQYQKAKRMAEGEAPGQVLSRNIHTENAYGLRYYDLSLVNGKLLKGWYDESGQAGEFIAFTRTAVSKDTSILEALVEQGYYRPVHRMGVSFWRANSSQITATLFQILGERKKGSIKDHPDQMLATFILSGLFYCTSRKSLTTAPVVIEKMADSPQKRQWQAFLDGWLALVPDSIEKGELVITPSTQPIWQDWCNRFLKRSTLNKSHAKNKNMQLEVLQTLNGSVTLVSRKASSGQMIYQLMPMNNNNVPKPHVPALAMTSPNMVLLDKDILSKGYNTDIEELVDISGQRLDIAKLLNAGIAEAMGLNCLSLIAIARTPVKLTLQGLPVQWFENHMLERREHEGTDWKKRKSLDYSHKDPERDGINQNALKRLLAMAPRSDKTIAIGLEGEYVSLTLEYKNRLDRFVLDDDSSA